MLIGHIAVIPATSLTAIGRIQVVNENVTPGSVREVSAELIPIYCHNPVVSHGQQSNRLKTQ